MTATIPNIADELAGLDHVPVASLEPFQGDLKELSEREYNKLKKSILENNLIVPFFVWLETNKLLDGHQRQRVFMREGWLMDVPVVYISAKSEQDAKRKLLVISSQYGHITQEGFDSFSWDIKEDWLVESVNFDALPFAFGELVDVEFGEPGDNARLLNSPGKVKFTLFVEQVEVFERAVKSAGLRNRGEAVIEICKAYLDEKGQFDFEIKNLFTETGAAID